MRKDRLGRLGPARRRRDALGAPRATLHLYQRLNSRAGGRSSPRTVALMTDSVSSFDATTRDEIVMATEPPHVDVAQALAMLTHGARLLDVREDDEWHAGHAPQAEHRPLGSVDPGDYASTDTLVVVCRSGKRSQQAASTLHGAGVNVHDLDGGMSAWSQAGQPVVRDDGAPGSIV